MYVHEVVSQHLATPFSLAAGEEGAVAKLEAGQCGLVELCLVP